MPALSNLVPKKATNGPLVAFLQSRNENSVDVIVVDLRTRKLISKNTFTSDTAKKFVADISKLFTKRFKAVILSVFNFKAEGFKHNVEFCEVVRDKFALLHLPTYFISLSDFMTTCVFIASETVVEFGETVILLFDAPLRLGIFDCKYTKVGYEKKIIDHIEFDEKTNVKTLHKKIIRSTKPKKIIFATSNPKSPKALFMKNQVFSGDFVLDVIDMKKLRDVFDVSFLAETAKWVLDKSYTKYYFQPECGRKFGVFFFTNDKGNPTPHDVCSVTSDDNLPIVKTVLISKIPLNHRIYQMCLGKENETLQELDLLKDCHFNQVILSVDSESFPSMKIKPYLIPEIVEMPKIFNQFINPKIPFIGIYGGGNYSVICYCKNNECEYEFLESWNGVYGNDLSVTFHNKKPVFGSAIHEIKECNPASAVFDIIKIMSMPPDNIKVGKLWNFNITKDEKNPVLLEFDTFDGTQKLASPAFLMAMLIRQHLKAIEAEVGRKPTQIGFCFVARYNADEKKRIENQIQESCDLLKIDSVFMFC